MTDYVEGPRHYRITDGNHGAKVLAAAYIMMSVALLYMNLLPSDLSSGAKQSSLLLLEPA
jgi:hypothetical protein